MWSVVTGVVRELVTDTVPCGIPSRRSRVFGWITALDLKDFQSDFESPTFTFAHALICWTTHLLECTRTCRTPLRTRTALAPLPSPVPSPSWQHTHGAPTVRAPGGVRLSAHGGNPTGMVRGPVRSAGPPPAPRGGRGAGAGLPVAGGGFRLADPHAAVVPRAAARGARGQCWTGGFVFLDSLSFRPAPATR